MANLRFEVVAEAFKKRPVEVEAPKVRQVCIQPPEDVQVSAI